MAGFQCPGDGCGNEVSRQPVRDDAGRRWVGTTCRDCEQRALDGLSERNLARLTLDPYLRPAVVRMLFDLHSEAINAALAQRGRRYLQPSVADSLGVVDDEPTVPLEPFWPRYRSFDGDRDGATVAAGPQLWSGLECDDAALEPADPPPTPLLATSAMPPPVDETDPVGVDRDLLALDTVTTAETEVMPIVDDESRHDDVRAAEVVDDDDHTPSSPGARGRRRWSLLALAALVVVGGAGVAWALTRDGDDDGDLGAGSSTSATDGGASTESSSEESTVPARSATTVVRAATPTLTATSVGASTGTEATSTPTSAEGSDSTIGEGSATTGSADATTTTAAGNAVVAARWVDLVDGAVYLRGTVPDDATGERIQRVVTDAAGADNVVAEQEVALGSPSLAELPLVIRNADLFAAGSTEPTDAVDGLVDLALELLAQNPDATIEVGGHTDDVGEAPDNLELSRARAQAVYDTLVEAGADADRLEVTAYGETRPIAVNATEVGRAANRRIELSVSGAFG